MMNDREREFDDVGWAKAFMASHGVDIGAEDAK
jgi:hypothetical protein